MLVILLAIVFLTVLTEIGGLALWLALGISAAAGGRHKWINAGLTAATFIVLYGIATVWIGPALAPSFGRVPLNCFAASEMPYEANSPLYCALNRHYVRPEVRDVVEALATHMAGRFPGTITTYLDADFPFPIGLPLVPHLSHDDGRKLDLALFYVERASGDPKPRAGAWPVGYWAFAPARPDPEQPSTCRENGPMRWDMSPLQRWFQNLVLDTARTTSLLAYLATANEASPVSLVFVEPYLAERLGVGSPKIRFAGCHAARHDDHIHVEMR